MTSTSQHQWSFKGDYFEACNCEVNCACVFGSSAHYDDCQVALAWHIDSGRYGDVVLDGLNFALVARTPKMMSAGNWTAVIYLDDRAADDQREALRAIVSGDAGGGFGRRKALITNLLGTKSTPINYEVKDRGRSVSIPGGLELEVEGIRGDRPDEDVLLVNDPRASERGGNPRTIARSTVYQHTQEGLKWDNSGKTGYYAPVEMSGP